MDLDDVARETTIDVASRSDNMDADDNADAVLTPADGNVGVVCGREWLQDRCAVLSDKLALRRITILSIANCGITDIQSDAMRALSHLEYLDISGNAITSLAAFSRYNCPVLWMLLAGGNRIDSVAPMVGGAGRHFFGRVSLVDNDIGPDEIEGLAQLPAMELCVSGNPLYNPPRAAPSDDTASSVAPSESSSGDSAGLGFATTLAGRAASVRRMLFERSDTLLVVDNTTRPASLPCPVIPPQRFKSLHTQNLRAFRFLRLYDELQPDGGGRQRGQVDTRQFRLADAGAAGPAGWRDREPSSEHVRCLLAKLCVEDYAAAAWLDIHRRRRQVFSGLHNPGALHQRFLRGPFLPAPVWAGLAGVAVPPGVPQFRKPVVQYLEKRLPSAHAFWETEARGVAGEVYILMTAYLAYVDDGFSRELLEEVLARVVVGKDALRTVCGGPCPEHGDADATSEAATPRLYRSSSAIAPPAGIDLPTHNGRRETVHRLLAICHAVAHLPGHALRTLTDYVLDPLYFTDEARAALENNSAHTRAARQRRSSAAAMILPYGYTSGVRMPGIPDLDSAFLFYFGLIERLELRDKAVPGGRVSVCGNTIPTVIVEDGRAQALARQQQFALLRQAQQQEAKRKSVLQKKLRFAATLMSAATRRGTADAFSPPHDGRVPGHGTPQQLSPIQRHLRARTCGTPCDGNALSAAGADALCSDEGHGEGSEDGGGGGASAPLWEQGFQKQAPMFSFGATVDAAVAAAAAASAVPSSAEALRPSPATPESAALTPASAPLPSDGHMGRDTTPQLAAKIRKHAMLRVMLRTPPERGSGSAGGGFMDAVAAAAATPEAPGQVGTPKVSHAVSPDAMSDIAPITPPELAGNDHDDIDAGIAAAVAAPRASGAGFRGTSVHAAARVGRGGSAAVRRRRSSVVSQRGRQTRSSVVEAPSPASSTASTSAAAAPCPAVRRPPGDRSLRYFHPHAQGALIIDGAVGLPAVPPALDLANDLNYDPNCPVRMEAAPDHTPAVAPEDMVCGTAMPLRGPLLDSASPTPVSQVAGGHGEDLRRLSAHLTPAVGVPAPVAHTATAAAAPPAHDSPPASPPASSLAADGGAADDVSGLKDVEPTHSARSPSPSVTSRPPTTSTGRLPAGRLAETRAEAGWFCPEPQSFEAVLTGDMPVELMPRPAITADLVNLHGGRRAADAPSCAPHGEAVPEAAADAGGPACESSALLRLCSWSTPPPSPPFWAATKLPPGDDRGTPPPTPSCTVVTPTLRPAGGGLDVEQRYYPIAGGARPGTAPPGVLAGHIGVGGRYLARPASAVPAQPAGGTAPSPSDASAPAADVAKDTPPGGATGPLPRALRRRPLSSPSAVRQVPQAVPAVGHRVVIQETAMHWVGVVVELHAATNAVVILPETRVACLVNERFEAELAQVHTAMSERGGEDDALSGPGRDASNDGVGHAHSSAPTSTTNINSLYAARSAAADAAAGPMQEVTPTTAHMQTTVRVPTQQQQQQPDAPVGTAPPPLTPHTPGALPHAGYAKVPSAMPDLHVGPHWRGFVVPISRLQSRGQLGWAMCRPSVPCVGDVVAGADGRGQGRHVVDAAAGMETPPAGVAHGTPVHMRRLSSGVSEASPPSRVIAAWTDRWVDLEDGRAVRADDLAWRLTIARGDTWTLKPDGRPPSARSGTDASSRATPHKQRVGFSADTTAHHNRKTLRSLDNTPGSRPASSSLVRTAAAADGAANRPGDHTEWMHHITDATAAEALAAGTPPPTSRWSSKPKGHCFRVEDPDLPWHSYTEEGMRKLAAARGRAARKDLIRQQRAACDGEPQWDAAMRNPLCCSGSLSSARVGFASGMSNIFLPTTLRTQLSESWRETRKQLPTTRPPSAPVPGIAAPAPDFVKRPQSAEPHAASRFTLSNAGGAPPASSQQLETKVTQDCLDQSLRNGMLVLEMAELHLQHGNTIVADMLHDAEPPAWMSGRAPPLFATSWR